MENVALDKRLTWGSHVKSKIDILNTRLYLVTSYSKSKLRFKTKFLICKSHIRPIWTYGVQLRACAKLSHIKTISLPIYFLTTNYSSSFQLLFLQTPKYWNCRQLTKDYYKKFYFRLSFYSNQLIFSQYSISFLDNPPCRLKMLVSRLCWSSIVIFSFLFVSYYWIASLLILIVSIIILPIAYLFSV